MKKQTIVLASNNQKKIKELKQMLPDMEVKSLSEIACNDDIPETANTFQGNALLKAQYIVDRYKIPCFSDDSGLVVNALDGAPGVFSARYAGPQKNDEDNMNKLLQELKNKDERSAYFITVICYHDGAQAHYFEGRIEGEITTEKMGSDGFGYDPIFIPRGEARTFAQMGSEEKNKNSHRSKAMAQLKAYFQENSL